MSPIPLILPFAKTALSAIGSTLQVTDGLEAALRMVESIQALESANVNESLNVISTDIAHQSAMLTAIQSSIGAIGMTSTIGCALTAVNVFQLVKVEQQLKHLSKQLDDGFVDLKLFFSERLDNILERQQQQRLLEAYGYYIKGLAQLQSALLIGDKTTRGQTLSNCLGMLVKSLAIYDARIDQQVNLPAQLRHLECSWAISSSIAEIYCLQAEYRAGLHNYRELQRRIIRDVATVSSKLNADNYQFVVADLQWLFENDMKLIAAKIAALEYQQNGKALSTLTVAAPIMADQTSINNLTLGAAATYLDCLLTPDKTWQVHSVVQQSRYLATASNQAPLLQICQSYQEIQQLLGNDAFAQPIELLITAYAKKATVAEYAEQGIYCLNHIPTKKLAIALSSYAQQSKPYKPLLLFDNNLFGFDNKIFGFSKNGFLITRYGLDCPESPGPLPWSEIVTITASTGDLLNINNRYLLKIAAAGLYIPKVSDGVATTNPLKTLFIDINKSLMQIWLQRGTLLRYQGKLEEAKAAYQRAQKLDTDDLDGAEGLLLLAPSFAALQKYTTVLQRRNNLSRLQRLVAQRNDFADAKFTALSLANGDYYLGGYNAAAEPHGEGIALGTTGKYAGQWHNGRHHGTGHMTWTASGDTYTGEWQADVQHGQGVFTSGVGEKYDGTWQNGQRHGIGRCSWADGSIYEGEWVDNLRHGVGRCNYADKTIYQGNWIQGLRAGLGTLTWPNGDCYNGNWIANERQGHGRLTLANGSYYEGEWQDNQQHGRGLMIWTSGLRERYEGDWLNDLPHGKGQMTWRSPRGPSTNDGAHYNGDWVRGQRHGIGTLVWNNGDTYVGEWQNNLRHGQGTMRTGNGNYQGLWQADVPLLSDQRAADWV